MPRSRNIKPGFYKNDRLAECSRDTRLMFACLWMLADREGRLENRPRKIKGEIFPFDDDITALTVKELLNNLSITGFIRLYNYNGCDYIQIDNFLKHQNPHGTEKDSDIPSEDGYLTIYERTKNNEIIKNSKKLVFVEQLDTKITVKEQLNNSYEYVNKQFDNALIPDSLIPDSLIPDSLIPDSVPTKVGTRKLKKKPPDKLKSKQSETTLLETYNVTGQVADDFLAIRRKKMKPLTQTAMDGIVREAGTAGISVSQAITICAERGWLGFNASWDWQGGSKINGRRQEEKAVYTPTPFAKYLETNFDSIDGEVL